MPKPVIMLIIVLTAALTIVGCGGSDEFTQDDAESLYLAWMQAEYGALADQTIDKVGIITSDGDCYAAAIVEEAGHDVTIFVRDGEIVNVLTGHVTEWVVDGSEDCYERP